MNRATRATTIESRGLVSVDLGDGDEDSSSEASSQAAEKESLRRITTLVGHAPTTRAAVPQLSRFPFIEGHAFQVFVGTAIVLSLVALAVETDRPDWRGWWLVDNVFLVIFLVELVLRVLHKGPAPFLLNRRERLWNLLDSTLVIIGIIEVWIGPMSIGTALYEDNNFNDLWALVLRVLRLLRLVRLMRVFRMVQKLASFIDAIAGMLGPFMLIITILFGFNLFVSIILTHCLGRGEGLAENVLLSPLYTNQVRIYFRDVTTSFFTLFQIITTDNWYKIAGPLIQLDSRWRFFFVFFIAFFSWTMISILTAVASDNVISATSDRREKEALAQERQHKEFLRLLRTMFNDADEDGNGLLDKGEFDTLLEGETLQQMLQTLEIPVKKEDLKLLWEVLDVNGSHVLTIDEFVDGLAYLNEEVPSTRHIVDIDYSIRRLWVKLEAHMDGLRAKIIERRKHNESMLDLLRKQEEVQWQQAMSLWLWKEWAVKEDLNAFPPDVRQFVLLEVQAGLPAALVEKPGSLVDAVSWASLKLQMDACAGAEAHRHDETFPGPNGQSPSRSRESRGTASPSWWPTRASFSFGGEAKRKPPSTLSSFPHEATL